MINQILNSPNAIRNPEPIVSPAAEPCPCGSSKFWIDIASNYHCLACDPPVAKGLVRSRLHLTATPTGPRWSPIDPSPVDPTRGPSPGRVTGGVDGGGERAANHFGPSGQPAPCSCGSAFFWQDLSERTHCLECEPPAAKGLVHSRLTIVTTSTGLEWMTLSSRDKRAWIDESDELYEVLRLEGCAIGPVPNQAFDSWWQRCVGNGDAAFALDKEFYRRHWSPDAVRQRTLPNAKSSRGQG